MIDGAVVARMKGDNPLETEAFIARNREDVLSASGLNIALLQPEWFWRCFDMRKADMLLSVCLVTSRCSQGGGGHSKFNWENSLMYRVVLRSYGEF